MLTALAAMTVALVAGDDVALRAAPERTAAQQAALWRGDWLELRGERKGWYKVYDHRHERPGWIYRDNVRLVEVDEAHTGELAAVVDFLRDASGSESLGIAYAALYLRAAPAAAIQSRTLASLGIMAERLARRASAPGTVRDQKAIAAQLEVAESWGVHFLSLEQEERTRICYDGDAYRYVLGMESAGDDRARAALALTDPACTAPGLGLSGRQAVDEGRLALLEPIDPTQVAGWLGNRLRLRRAQIGAGLAWTLARRGDPAAATRMAEGALAAYLRVDKAELADEDRGSYDEAALGIAASRWAAATPAAPSGNRTKALTLVAAPGSDGDVCVNLAVGGKPQAAAPLRCSHGQIWSASFRPSPDGKSAALAVQPLPGWLELWLFRRGDDGTWSLEVLPPATEGPDLGYVELAGWSPDSTRALLVRESRTAGITHRSFEVLRLDTLAVEQQSSRFAGLKALRKWASPDWRAAAVSLR
jgi:hypothetical protein